MQIKLPWVIPTSFRICHAYSSFTVRRGDVYLKRTAAVLPLCASFGWSLVKNMEWKWILRFLRIADQRLEIFQISAGAFFLYWQGDLCISAIAELGLLKKRRKRKQVLFCLWSRHYTGEVNPPSDYGRSLRSTTTKKYQEREDSIQSGTYSSQSKELPTTLPLGSFERRKKSWNLHHSLSFRGDLLLLLGENCICSFLDAFVRSRTWRKGERE